MCEKCKELVKNAHVAYITERGKRRSNINSIEIGAAAFYDVIMLRATKNSAELMKRIEAGKPQVVTTADFAMAQMVGEQSTIEFMLGHTSTAMAKMELAATQEIEHLRMALTLIQSQATISGDDKLKKIAEDALQQESQFKQNSNELAKKIAQAEH